MTAEEFTSILCDSLDTERLNGRGLCERLTILRDRCAQLCRANTLPFSYNAAGYGLWYNVYGTRITAQTDLVLRRMTMQQLCGVIHRLLTECGDLAGEYPAFLNQHYSIQ